MTFHAQLLTTDQLLAFCVMCRIIVVGSQGSGKSWLAFRMGKKLGLPVLHLDVLYWLPGWQPSDKASFRARVAEAIAGEAWVVDGSYGGLAFDLIIARADIFIVIERSRWVCQWRVAWRSVFQRDRTRADLPEGCPERLDWKLMREAWRYDDERRPVIEAEHLRHGPPVPIIRLRSDRAIRDFLTRIHP